MAKTPKYSKFVLDDTLFTKKVKKLLAETKRSEREFVTQQSALFCVDLSRNTPPFASAPSLNAATYGPVKPSELAGHNAILKDLNNAFSILRDDYVAFLATTYGSGRIDQYFTSSKTGQQYRVRCAQVGLTLQDMRRWHNQKQNNRSGQVDQPPETSKYDSPDKMLVGEKLFAQYFNVEKQNVGIAKAAFAKAAVSLGSTRRVPKFIAKHMGKVHGRGVVRMIPLKGTVAFISARAAGLHHTLKFIPRLKIHRRHRMYKALGLQLKKMKQASGFK